MSSKYEVAFSVFGTATVSADTAKEAEKLASKVLIRRQGPGTEIEFQIEGVDECEVVGE